MKKAILFGASGFIGSFLLEKLLKSQDYTQVTIVVRKALNIHHPKLTTLIGDYHALPNLKSAIKADEVFIALGTTKKNTPNQKEYYQVDHDYPVLAARIALENGAKSLFVVTAVGANAASKVFYVRTKGEVENDLVALGYEHTYIFRPSMLLGQRKEHRTLEKTLIKIWPVLHPVLAGGLKKYRGIEGEQVAQAMLNAAKKQTEKVAIYHWEEMKALQHQKAVMHKAGL